MPGDRDSADDDDGALGAAWGGGGGSGGDADTGGENAGGPSPRADRPNDADGPRADFDEPPADFDEPPDEFGDPSEDVSTTTRITLFLQAHKTAFTISLLAYALFVMPWLYQNGFQFLGLVGGTLFLGGIVLVTVANAQAARESLRGGDERRGF